MSLLGVETEEPGNLVIHVTEARNHSSLSNNGDACLLVHVYLFSNNLVLAVLDY
jgi:hypothetical protein